MDYLEHVKPEFFKLSFSTIKTKLKYLEYGLITDDEIELDITLITFIFKISQF